MKDTSVEVPFVPSIAVKLIVPTLTFAWIALVPSAPTDTVSLNNPLASTGPSIFAGKASVLMVKGLVVEMASLVGSYFI